MSAQETAAVDDAKQYRAYIECDACGTNNPKLRCGRCKRSYYCSVTCQRDDWKQGHKSCCFPIADRIKALRDFEASPKTTGKNTTCGICWDDPMTQPVVLDCQHAFCFTCLKAWQGRLDPTTVMGHMEGHTESLTTTCPLCRQGIKESVVVDTMRKALAYCHQGERTPKAMNRNGGDTKRSKLFANILLHVDPYQTIDVIHKILELHEVGNVKRRELDQKLQAPYQASLSGNQALAEQLMNNIDAHYGHVEPWPRILGNGPLISVRTTLAKAYETTDQLDLAYREYTDMTQRLSQQGSDETTNPDNDCALAKGISQCLWKLGRFTLALYSAERVVQLDRTAPGGHLLVAQAQRAIARTHTGDTMAVVGTERDRCTLQDAVRTMYRGLVYETPWGDAANDEANRALLQELLAEVESAS